MISLENLVFATKDKDSMIKLIDFGSARVCKPGGLTAWAKLDYQSATYIAPEVLRRDKYDTQVDMWSAGVVLYMILCGFPPFYEENDALGPLFRKITTARYDMPNGYWDDISDSAKDLVRKLLQVDPKKRLTAAEALRHPWLIWVNQKVSELLVYGFLRENFDAPMDIMQVCWRWYFMQICIG